MLLAVSDEMIAGSLEFGLLRSFCLVKVMLALLLLATAGLFLVTAAVALLELPQIVSLSCRQQMLQVLLTVGALALQSLLSVGFSEVLVQKQ